MKTVRIDFKGGNEIITKINATEEEIREKYPIGGTLNAGCVDDDFQVIARVSILNREERE